MGCGSSQSSPTDPIAASVAIQPRENTINNFLPSIRHPVIQQPCSVTCAGLEFSTFFRIENLTTCFLSQHQIHSDDPKEVMLRVQQLLLQQLPSPRAGLQNTNLLKVSLGAYKFLRNQKFDAVSQGAACCTKDLQWGATWWSCGWRTCSTSSPNGRSTSRRVLVSYPSCRSISIQRCHTINIKAWVGKLPLSSLALAFSHF